MDLTTRLNLIAILLGVIGVTFSLYNHHVIALVIMLIAVITSFIAASRDKI